jgi:RNA polymerase sigma-70 factor (ECF subfamily)
MRAAEAPNLCLAMTDASQDSTMQEKISGGVISIEGLLAYQETVFRICLGHSRNYVEAEDLTQEVYLKAYQSLSVLRDPSLAKEWILRIAKNACLDHQKKGRVRRMLLRRWVKDADLSSEFHNPDENLDGRIEQLKSSIQRLPKKLRDIFVLREYGHLTYEELAATLRLNKGTVMSRLNRARQRITATLREKTHGQG